MITLSAEKMAFLVQHLGEVRARKVVETLREVAKELETAGITFKALADVLDDPVTTYKFIRAAERHPIAPYIDQLLRGDVLRG